MAAAVCLLSLASCATLEIPYESRTPIAVMDFKAGVGVEQNEVNGLSDMLINSLYKTGEFKIVERSQLNKVIREQKFQQSDLTSDQVVEIGRILGVKAILIGSVNFIPTGRTLYQKATETVSGEYNVDIRVVDCTTGELMTTAGRNKTSKSTYRQLMENISEELAENFVTPEELEVKQQRKEMWRMVMKESLSTVGVGAVFLVGLGLIYL